MFKAIVVIRHAQYSSDAARVWLTRHLNTIQQRDGLPVMQTLTHLSTTTHDELAVAVFAGGQLKEPDVSFDNSSVFVFPYASFNTCKMPDGVDAVLKAYGVNVVDQPDINESVHGDIGATSIRVPADVVIVPNRDLFKVDQGDK